jgi:hypothetical protein
MVKKYCVMYNKSVYAKASSKKTANKKARILEKRVPSNVKIKVRGC